MVQSRLARIALRVAAGLTLAFLYAPIVVLTLYAFNRSRVQRWPIEGLSPQWFGRALANDGARAALLTSVRVGLGATLIALVLGSLAAFAVQRYRFFGRDTISFLVVIPIALPGIVTGMALNATFSQAPLLGGVPFGTFTIIVGHATFCMVIVFNNVAARLRRTARNLEEASLDLGADAVQTFRFVTFPAVRTALLAGALLAFALSFDEVIVTTFTAGAEQTLPIWILTNLSRPNQLPIVNVVGVAVIALPTIANDLGGGLAGQQWVANAYLLTLASLILVSGSLADLYGERRVFTLGVAGFGIASLLCAIAPSVELLVAARALQGVAGALLTPASLAIIVAVFPERERGAAIGSWTAWGGIAYLIGPLVGGQIIDSTSWR